MVHIRPKTLDPPYPRLPHDTADVATFEEPHFELHAKPLHAPMSPALPPNIHIRPATFPGDKNAVVSLFQAYEQHILNTASIKLDFQNFTQELASLPGKYSSENRGALYLAYLTLPPRNGQPAIEKPIGCVGLRAFKSRSAELKRLYLTSESRGLGVGRALVSVAVERARQEGYEDILLDTLGSMAAARGLYEGLGFVETGGYYESCEDAVFYRLVLQGL